MLLATGGALVFRTLLAIAAAMVFAWLFAAGLVLLIGHTGAWIPLAAVGVAAVLATLWLLRSDD